MTKQKIKSSNPIEKPLTEDEYYEMVSEENSRLELEGYYNHFDQFTKKELILMLIEFQDTEQKLYAWLMSNKEGFKAYGGGIRAIKDEFDRLRRDRNLTVKNRKIARQKQAIEKMSQKSEAQALGVDDFYGLLREAVAIFDKTPNDQITEKTNTANIRKIIVDLLCRQKYSRHSYQRDKWIDTVKRNITSKHINNARDQLKKINPKAT